MQGDLMLFLLISLFIIWIYLALGHGQFWKIKLLMDPKNFELQLAPPVCVIIPARNESEVIQQTLPALLQQNYPGALNILLIDDHSTDSTAQIAEQIIQRYPTKTTCTIIPAEPLQPGWTGKLWALEQGLKWIQNQPNLYPDFFLFTDADILHSADSISKLISYAQFHKKDLVSLMVKLHCKSFWEKLLIPAFVFFFQKLYPFSWVNKNSCKTAGAAGGCILLSAKMLKKINGLYPIRSQLIDDCSLAKQVKKAGGKISLGLTDEVQSLRTYSTLLPIWQMVSRTAFTQLRCSNIILIFTVLGMIGIYLFAPIQLFIALIQKEFLIAGLCALIWLIMCFIYQPMIQFYRLPYQYSFSLPLAAILYSAMTIHSAWMHWQGKAGQWKNRSYPS